MDSLSLFSSSIRIPCFVHSARQRRVCVYNFNENRDITNVLKTIEESVGFYVSVRLHLHRSIVHKCPNIHSAFVREREHNITVSCNLKRKDISLPWFHSHRTRFVSQTDFDLRNKKNNPLFRLLEIQRNRIGKDGFRVTRKTSVRPCIRSRRKYETNEHRTTKEE